MTQPEALRLADLLEPCCLTIGDAQQAVAAAELRRLHAENTELREENAELRAWFEVESGQLKRAVVAEREACAKVCEENGKEPDDHKSYEGYDEGYQDGSNNCAAAIRARGLA